MDLFPGAVEMIVLQALRQQFLYGYALAQLVKRQSEEILQVKRE